MTESITHAEYFRFEEDFIEDNLRCIPMIVRMKLDMIGIKLPLKTWSRFNAVERTQLAASPCSTSTELNQYKKHLLELGIKYSTENLRYLDITENDVWNNPDQIPDPLPEKFAQFNQHINIKQWRSLSLLKRFALVKLSRPGHESRNFEKAIIEFGLFKKEV